MFGMISRSWAIEHKWFLCDIAALCYGLAESVVRAATHSLSLREGEEKTSWFGGVSVGEQE
jgi:hypothetical protein